MNKALIIFSIILSCEYAKGNSYEDATQKAGEAFYVQSGLNKMVKTKVEEIQNQLPVSIQKSLGVIIPIVDTVVKHRVEIKYEF